MQLYDYASGGPANYMTGNGLNNFVTAAGGYNIFTPDSLPGDTSFLTANTMYVIGIHDTRSGIQCRLREHYASRRRWLEL